MTTDTLNRAARRAQHKREARKPRAQRRQRDALPTNAVWQCVMRKRIRQDIESLRTRAGIHAYTGQDADNVADTAGRLFYVVCHASRAHALHTSADARIIHGAANALGDAVHNPATLEARRASIISGLAAAERLVPQLSTWALTAAALELDAHLVHSAIGTADFAALMSTAAT